MLCCFGDDTCEENMYVLLMRVAGGVGVGGGGGGCMRSFYVSLMTRSQEWIFGKAVSKRKFICL